MTVFVAPLCVDVLELHTLWSNACDLIETRLNIIGAGREGGREGGRGGREPTYAGAHLGLIWAPSSLLKFLPHGSLALGSLLGAAVWEGAWERQKVSWGGGVVGIGVLSG